ncbi:hypothetical protein B0H19DRAFT_82937 [Mycena capillaripes]|nr:hypothetical protein B0H19DRAFT_82937 [Mycena capillaripes]
MCPDDADDDAAECEPRLERERSGRDELHASLLTPFHPSGVRVVQRPRFGRKPILPSPQWRRTASHRSRAQPGRGGSSRFMSPKADENSGCRRSCGGMGAEVAGGVVQVRLEVGEMGVRVEVEVMSDVVAVGVGRTVVLRRCVSISTRD